MSTLRYPAGQADAPHQLARWEDGPAGPLRGVLGARLASQRYVACERHAPALHPRDADLTRLVLRVSPRSTVDPAPRRAPTRAAPHDAARRDGAGLRRVRRPAAGQELLRTELTRAGGPTCGGGHASGRW
eukprot:scaffold89828_cov50-Phaeocystis_antarctica.AAC.3